MELVQAIEHAELLQDILHVRASNVARSGFVLEKQEGDVPDMVLGNLDDIERVQ